MKLNEKQIHMLEVAEELFASKGFFNTSIRDIAAKADINVAMINYYFGSKEQLLNTLFEYRMAEMIEHYESLYANENLTSLQKMEGLISSLVNKIASQSRFHRIMNDENLRCSMPKVAELIKPYKINIIQIVQKIIAEGQQKGDFRENVDIPLLFSTYIGFINHSMQNVDFYLEINDLKIPENQLKDFYKDKIANHLYLINQLYLTSQKQ